LPRGGPPASNASVIALVCGILLSRSLTGIPAIIAAVGRRAMKRRPGQRRRWGMAIAGIVLRIVNLLGWTVWFFFSVVLADGVSFGSLSSAGGHRANSGQMVRARWCSPARRRWNGLGLLGRARGLGKRFVLKLLRDLAR
jgi:hypothetical protein